MLTTSQILNLWLLITFNTLLHWPDLPLWANLLSLSLLAWRLLLLKTDQPLPKRWWRWSLALISVTLTLLHYRSLAGQQPATTLLVLLISLKLLETVQYRDVMISLTLSYILLASKLLASQTLLMTLVLLVDVTWISALFFLLHQRDFHRVSWRALLRPTGKLLLQSSPMILLLFLLFPRFTSGFWSLGPTSVRSSGFDEELNPGDLSQLVLSDELAFRARLKGGVQPDPQLLYWRGAVLWQLRGMTWTRGPRWPEKISAAPPQGELIQQEISLEPRFTDWLFALDVPHSLTFSDPIKQRQSQLQHGQTFKTTRPVAQRILYTAHSMQFLTPQGLSPLARKTYSQVPAPLHPTVQKLSEDLQRLTTANDRATFILRYFRKENFNYTLTPRPLNPKDELGDFLINTQSGFCEHYAAAFSTLMRLGGTPARVVIGFQGGRYNSIDNYYIVTDQDAHAWSEYWSDQSQSWVRVDPTMSVAPLRLTLGGQRFYQMDFENFPDGLSADQALQFHSALWSETFSRLWMSLDALANRWNLFLLKYDLAYQKKLLENIGWSQAPRGLLLLLSALGLTLFLYWIWRRPSTPSPSDPLARALRDLCTWTAQQGLTKSNNEGALNYSQRCLNHWPEDLTLHHLLHTYVELRYSKLPDANRRRRTQEFSRQVKEYLKARKRGGQPPRPISSGL